MKKYMYHARVIVEVDGNVTELYAPKEPNSTRELIPLESEKAKIILKDWKKCEEKALYELREGFVI